MPVFESRHPLVKHKITSDAPHPSTPPALTCSVHRLLRDKRTTPYQFRQLVNELCALVGYEATVDLGLKPKAVTTPLVDTTGHETSDIVGLVPVLRAGIGMVDPFLSMLPNAQVCFHARYTSPHETQMPSFPSPARCPPHSY